MTKADSLLIKELHVDLESPAVGEEGEPQIDDEPEPVFEDQGILADQPIYQATEQAVSLAHDAGIDLEEVAGTGQDGRILKGDVQAIIDVRIEMADVAVDGEGKIIGDFPEYLSMPDIFGRFAAVYHYSRTIHPMGGLGEEIKSPQEIKQFIEQTFFEKGWELAFVEPLGFGPDGLAVLWIFGKLHEGLESRHKEIWHIQRTLGANVMEGQITGFGADTYLNSYLDEGWSIFCAKALSRGGSEVPMLWVLVR